MEYGHFALDAMAKEIKEDMKLSSSDSSIDSFVAWLAMVTDENDEPGRPVFKECLNWILQNQNQEGCWGDVHVDRVAQAYPLDKELMKLCFANRILNLGLAEYFEKEIEEILAEVYQKYEKRGREAKPITNSVAERLFKDSTAFRLLRMHGYIVSSWSFCWFLKDNAIKDHLEANQECLWPVILSVYRATDLMFPGEDELEDARSFSRTLLEKNKTHKMIGYELKHPWIARLEHLDHRKMIEDEDSTAIWPGKASFLRMDGPHNDKLSELAVRNFHFRQSIFRNELEELKMWTKKWGLDEMGFGREKTTYCYFATAASISLPHNSSAARIISAKTGVLVTVADDFYDMEGSLDELKSLTVAVQRWNGERLRGIGRIIFNALDELLQNMKEERLRNNGTDITFGIRRIWGETFGAWLKEAEWSKTGYIPSMEEYVETGMISVAAHTIALSASCVSNPGLSNEHLQMENFGTLTKLLMLLPRLLNDLQSYKKEQEQGKLNSVLLHMRENTGLEIEDSISHIKGIISEKRKELLKHVLMKQSSDLPKLCKTLHLSWHKVFEMFYDSSNRFDSDLEMLPDIQKALYDPITTGIRTSKPVEKPENFTRPYEAVKKLPNLVSM